MALSPIRLLALLCLAVASGSFVVDLNATRIDDFTPPVIVPTVDPPPNEAGWNNSVVHVSWVVEDPESGIATVGGGCQEATVTDDTPEFLITCAATNRAGLTASRDVTVRVDTTSPRVTFSTGSKLGAPIFGRNASLSLRAVDGNQNITRVEFFLEGTLVGVRSAPDADGAYAVPLDTSVFADDPAPRISAIAYDLAGNAGPAQGLLNTSNRGLVAAYSFEETGGKQVLDTAAHDWATAPNNGKFGNGVTRVPGVFGSALSFDGLKGMVIVPDSPSLDLKEMTLEAWVKPTRVTSWQSVILKQWRSDPSTGLVYGLYAAAGTEAGPATFVRPSGWSSDQVLGSASQLVPGRWYHLAATYDGAQLRFYINGAPTGTTPVSTPITASTMPLFIGGNQLWGEYFSGVIDEVRIYNRALSDAEIVSAAPASSRSIELVDIGTLGGERTTVNGMNANDQVVGGSQTIEGDMHAFVWLAATGMIDLGTLGGSFSEAWVINARGQVAGLSSTSDGEQHAFLWDPKAGMTDLGFRENRIVSINAAGHVLAGTGLWTPTTGLLQTGMRVGGLNDYDQIVGDAINGFAAIWDLAEGLVSLGDRTFIHGRFRVDYGINNRGEVGCRYIVWSCIWTKATGITLLHDAAGLDIQSEPTAITSSSDVVGFGFYWNATSGAIRLPIGGRVGANARGLVVSGVVWSPKDGLLDLRPACTVGRLANDNGLVLCGGSLIGYVGP